MLRPLGVAPRALIGLGALLVVLTLGACSTPPSSREDDLWKIARHHYQTQEP